MLKQGLNQKLLQKLSPQQIQLMKLLQVPTAELEQRIKEELESNPALEEGEAEPADEEIISNEGDSSDERQEAEDDFQAENDAPEDTQVSADEAEADALEDAIRNDDFDAEYYLDDDDVPYYKLNAGNNSPDEERYESPLTGSFSYQDNLLNQLGTLPLDDTQQMLARHLIGSLDDDGYLRRDLASVSDDLAFTQNISAGETDLLEVLRVLQTLDPPGICARDLRECLLLQLERRSDHDPSVQVAIRVLSEHMEDFSKRHYEKIQKALELEEEDLKEAIDVIRGLNPRPGGGSSEDTRTSQQIIPDFLLQVSENQLDLSLNSKNDPDLRVSRSFSEMLDSYSKDKNSKSGKEAISFIRQKIDSAKWFIDAIRQRQYTLLHTMSAIMDFQKEYFLKGDERFLRPMILKDIADQVGLDISTVSRVANSKFIQTPYGTFPLKYFFSEGLSTESGEEASSREVKKILTEAIAEEDKKHPLPDDKLADILKAKGYTIARRTIAKYREQLNIPVARLRKDL